jgi:energy-coupling factor transporter ATP-binding protein EcfA2
MNDVTALFYDLANRLHSGEASRSVADLVLAAFHGDDGLDTVLAGGPAPRPPAERDATAAGSADVFLESIQVTGFRGIGATATLQLQPRAGLTLVIGRNGSGKSSFAEAAELALTDDSMRWAQRPVVFREGWRNLHQGDDAEIIVRLRLDGDAPPVTIQRRWERRATDPSDAAMTTFIGTAAQPAGRLPAWLGRVDLYRPFLSARDLERVITAKPAELYDALAPILGLAPLAAADLRLQRRRKERDDRVKALKASFTELRALLAEIDDDRARRAVKALGGQAWLLRLELETALDRYWSRVRPEIAAVHAQRPKLLMLAAFAGPDLARRVSYLWWALSRAGHHHRYELGITFGELARLRAELVAVTELLRSYPTTAPAEVPVTADE